MKTLALLFVLLLAFAAGEAAWSKELSSELTPMEKANADTDKINVRFQNPLRDIEPNLKSYTELLKVFEEFKDFDESYAIMLLSKIRSHDTLSGTELFALRRMITTFYKINTKMQDFAKVYDFGGFRMSKTFASGSKNLPLMKAHLIWLSGQLLVIDHLKTMHEILYDSDGTFRRIVKNALLDKKSTEGTTKTLNDIIKTDEYTVEVAESERFNQQINLVVEIGEDLKTILKNEPATLQLLETIISNKTTSVIIRGELKLKLEDFKFVDSFIGTINTLTGWLSGVFGNIVGSVKWRKGFLYKNDIAYEIADNNLQPMDVIIEKSPFVLTDKLIPGHYGHVAVYLGTKAQLEAIGMWEHPDLIKYHNDIENGKVILEAVRSGVRLNTLEEFLNIDELTIIRKKDALSNKTLLKDQITRGIDQIGKPYDFNFNTVTLDKIVCSELIYIFYGNVHWPTQYRLGRATITPDDIAEILFYKNTKFDLIKFMVSKKEHRIELVNLDYISEEFKYELRNKDGAAIENENGADNSYWKRATKCYTVVENEQDPTSMSDENSSPAFKRICNTSYKEFEYAEKDSLQSER